MHVIQLYYSHSCWSSAGLLAEKCDYDLKHLLARTTESYYGTYDALLVAPPIERYWGYLFLFLANPNLGQPVNYVVTSAMDSSSSYI